MTIKEAQKVLWACQQYNRKQTAQKIDVWSLVNGKNYTIFISNKENILNADVFRILNEITQNFGFSFTYNVVIENHTLTIKAS